jgi:biotin carboxyl carrier protein
MGYLVMGSVLFGVLIMLSLIWTATALGPKNPETTWFGGGIGPEVTSLTHEGETFEVSDYPEGEWQAPTKGEHLADLEGENDTLAEQSNVNPVLRALVSDAINPKKQESVESLVQGQVSLEPGEFEIVDLRLKEATISEKESLIAMARAVPSERLTVVDLGGAEEAEVEEYLVKVGDEIDEGDPILLSRTAEGQPVQVTASTSGRIVSLGQRKGDRIKEKVPVATVDISEQAGAQSPVEVGAVRVRGFPRKPAIFYLVASIILFAIHLALLNRAEKARRSPIRVPEEETKQRELIRG